MAPKTPKKAAANGPATAAATKSKAVGSPKPQTRTPSASKVPEPFKFPLAVLLAFFLTSVLYQVASLFSGTEFGSVSRKSPTLLQAVGFNLWRIFELAVAWYLGYDGRRNRFALAAGASSLTSGNTDLDVTSLTLLTRTPYYFLLSTFYGIAATKSLLYLTIDVVSAALPFTLLRTRLPQHTPRSKPTLPNASILSDPSIRALTLTASSAVYAITISFSLRTWTPAFLVAHLSGVATVELAHSALPIFLAAAFTPLGWASSTLLFAPAAAASATGPPAAPFDPVTASLRDTLVWNVWGWRRPTKVLVGRTAVLALLVAASSFVKVWGAVDGADASGAAAWAALWALSSAVQGPLLGWIGLVGKDKAGEV